MIKRIFLAIFLLTFASADVTAQDVMVQGKTLREDVLAERILIPALRIPNYRDEMRRLVERLSEYAKNRNPEFIIMVRDGVSLLHRGEWEQQLVQTQFAEEHNAYTQDDVHLAKLFNRAPPKMQVGTEMTRYLRAIDGVVFSNLLCLEKTLPEDISSLLANRDISIFSAEQCSRAQTMSSYPSSPENKRIIPNVPPVRNNPSNVFSLRDVKNYLMLKDNSFYKSKDEIMEAFAQTNHDMLIINPFFRKNHTFNQEEIRRLKMKKIGGQRLLLAYFNLSGINESMYFWRNHWRVLDPSWIRLPSPIIAGNYIIEYWTSDWHTLASEYLQGVMHLGFDGIYFEGVDYHLIFENLTPI